MKYKKVIIKNIYVEVESEDGKQSKLLKYKTGDVISRSKKVIYELIFD